MVIKKNQQPPPIPSAKPFQLESFDLTVSTVDSDGLSVSSCSNESSSTSSSSASSSSLDANLIIETSLAVSKRVSFLEDEQGQVQCYVKNIDRVEDPDLWWSTEENRDIIRDCCDVVDFYKRRPRMCSSMTNILRFKWLEDDHPLDSILDFLQEQDLDVLGRGLEQHIVGTSKHYVVRHRQAVLSALERIKGTAREDSLEGMEFVAECAASTSGDCKELARCVGIHDEVEAYADDLE